METVFKELEAFFSTYKILHYKKHEVLMRPDDTPNGIFYLVKGYARLYAISETGEELTLIYFYPGNAFPLTYALNDTPNKYYLEACTPIELRKAPIKDFLAFIHKNPAVFTKITSGILARVNGILERMEYLVFGNSYQKVASIIAICATRFGSDEENGRFTHLPLTHKDLGMMTGLTRETVSTEVKRLERKHLIIYEGKNIIVPNMQKLKEEALLTHPH
jgi:CRP-like cAMP-binding protein